MNIQMERYTGNTDIQIKRKFDGSFECAVGFGNNIEEALKDTIDWFNKMLEEDYPIDSYPEGLSEADIEYLDSSDF